MDTFLKWSVQLFYYSKLNIIMKFNHLILVILFITTLASCKKEAIQYTKNETTGLVLTKTITNHNHQILLYTSTGKFQQGYNKIYIQLKNTDGSLISNATLSWKTLMHMTTMQHSSPYSSINSTESSNTLYEGFIVFQMAGNATEYWELQIEYFMDGVKYNASSNIDVIPFSKKNIVSFTGSDNIKYILALVAPTQPKVATNDMQAMLFKMQNMHSYPIVNSYKIKIDPRMPSMGNHGSPSNTDLVQNTKDLVYYGKLSLTMTGYWKINLMVENELGSIVKGEPVTSTNESSSLFFEMEF